VALNSGRALGGTATLGGLFDRHLTNHPEYSPSTVCLYRQAEAHLAGLGSKRVASSITKAEARAWRAGLVEAGLAEATICRLARTVKAMFAEAVEDGLLGANPFESLPSAAPTPEKDWHYLPWSDLNHLIRPCSWPWKLLLALCRMAGLRQGEALALRWADVDLAGNRLRVSNLKTGRRTGRAHRDVPICPALHVLLHEAMMTLPSSERVIVGLGGKNLHREFKAICRKAHIQPWPHWCHTLRKNCEVDWMERFDVLTVCEWLGHGAEVARKHYHKASPEAFRQAADCGGSLPEPTNGLSPSTSRCDLPAGE